MSVSRRSTFALAGAGLAAGFAAPRLALAQDSKVLRFIPQIDLAFLDPHFTTAYVTRGHGHMVFDMLYGSDASFNPHPQMVAGHTIENDGKLWNLTLRPGLKWHDGEPVLAKDCVASIRRWAKRDALGGALMERTDELSAPDDRTIRFRLKRPFPLLPAALGKVTSPMPAMMPERLANTDPFTQITEMVGSGPFRFVASERLAGSRNVYVKFDGYVPREDGPQEWNAGPKRVLLDRVEWTTIPDAATKVAALRAGRAGLVGEPDPRPAAAAAAQPAGQDRDQQPDRLGRHDAAEPPAAALQQSGDPPRHAARLQPDRLHAVDRRRRRGDVPCPARGVLPEHADGQRGRARAAERPARPRQGQARC